MFLHRLQPNLMERSIGNHDISHKTIDYVRTVKNLSEAIMFSCHFIMNKLDI